MNPRFSCSNLWLLPAQTSCPPYPPLQSSCCRQFWRKSALCAHRHDPSSCLRYKGQPLRLSASCHRYGGRGGNEDVCPVRPVPPISVNASVGRYVTEARIRKTPVLCAQEATTMLWQEAEAIWVWSFFCITTDTKCRPPLTDMSFQHKFVTSPTRNPQ